MTVTATRSGNSDVPTQRTNESAPPPARSTDNSDGVKMLQLSSNAKAISPKQLAENDGNHWLGPAGYARLEDGKTFGKNEIAGVLFTTSDLLGVKTTQGERFWISRFTNPDAFNQAKTALDGFNAEHSDAPNKVEKRFQAAGFERYTDDYDPTGWRGIGTDPQTLKYAIVQDEYAAFVFDDGHVDGPEDLKMVYMHQSDDPELWPYVAVLPDVKREGLDPHRVFGSFGLPKHLNDKLNRIDDEMEKNTIFNAQSGWHRSGASR